MTKKIISIPSLGDSSEVEVIEICVKPGDSIGPEDPIIVLESDKAAMELPANQAGVVTSILVNLGDGVSEGMQFVELDVEDDAQEASAKAETELSQEQDIEKVDGSNPPSNEPFKGNKTRILNVPVPNLGESSEVEIIEVCIKEGDILEADAPLVVLESDKAAMEVPSDFDGTIKEIFVTEGQSVSEGFVFATIEVTEDVSNALDLDPINVEPAAKIDKSEKKEDFNIELSSKMKCFYFFSTKTNI